MSLTNRNQYEHESYLRERVNKLEAEHKIMKDALISMCHLYKVNAVEKAPYIAREALDKLK